ncbi:MAG: GGDEF domain-containing protein [Pseudomonadales bacterium]|nr:GGDEF domain-containing protein [Pseudomonadales bacterium]
MAKAPNLKDGDDKLDFDFERICILYSNTGTGYLGMAAAALCMAYFIAAMSEPMYATIWFIALMAAYLPRVIMSNRFNRKVDTGEIDKVTATPWENYFFLASIPPFVVFAAAIFMPYGENILVSLMFYSSVSLALIAGGILTYSTSLPAILLFLHVAILPLIARMFFLDGVVANTMSITLVISYILLIRLIPRQNRVLLENIALKIENKSQSLTDPLTNLSNRRRLTLHMENLIPASLRRNDPFSIILLDIDYFKQYNDTHGHNAGDEVLVQVSNILKECSRDQDLVVRYGGEEFLLVLPSTNVEAAKILMERIAKTIREETDVTVSGGLAMHSPDIEFDELVRQADVKLYSAKTAGRDRFVA